MLRRNGPVVKSVESVLRPEGSLWGERFVEEVGVSTRYNWLDSQFDNRLHLVNKHPTGYPTGCSTGWTTGYIV